MHKMRQNANGGYVKKQYLAEKDISTVELIDNIHEEHRESPMDFINSLRKEFVSFETIAWYAWTQRRKYESSQVDVQLQKRLRRAGK